MKSGDDAANSAPNPEGILDVLVCAPTPKVEELQRVLARLGWHIYVGHAHDDNKAIAFTQAKWTLHLHERRENHDGTEETSEEENEDAPS